MADFIDDFMVYTDGLPTPRLFRLWSGISLLAGALERRCWIETAQSLVFPNLFVLLVAPPGVGKTQSINPVEMIWTKAKKYHVAPNNVTKAALIDSLEKASATRVLNGGKNLLQYHSMLVAAGEFGVLVPGHDLEFLSVLNYIYDNPAQYREERRTMSRSVDIPNPQLSILAGVQPGYMSTMIPEEAWSMGFTSRLIMVYAGSSPSVPLFGTKASQKADLLGALVKRTEGLADLYGGFAVPAETVAVIEAWAATGFEPVPTHSKLTHYIPRRVLHVLKLCMVASISRGADMVITPEDFERAQTWLLAAEALMPDVFREMSGKSDASVMLELHQDLWRIFAVSKKPVHESFLISFLSAKVPSERVIRIIEIMTRSGMLATMGDKLFIPRPLNERGVE